MAGLSFIEHPEGTRFLYRHQGVNLIDEDRILEWSGSRSFVKLRRMGWISSDEASNLVVLEVLDSKISLYESSCWC
jgi:hypothetical protein